MCETVEPSQAVVPYESCKSGLISLVSEAGSPHHATRPLFNMNAIALIYPRCHQVVGPALLLLWYEMH